MINEFIIEPCRRENITRIVDGINEYNLSKVAALSDIWTPLDYTVKDEGYNQVLSKSRRRY